jgi:hypothetical protein
MRVTLIAAFAVIVFVGGFLVWSPSPHVRPFDANLTPLAESYVEGYCSGITVMRNYGDPKAASLCRETSAHTAEVDLKVVQEAFCAGVVDAGWPGSEQDCRDRLDSSLLWPTLDGEITSQWNNAHPYPGATFLTNIPTPADELRGNQRQSEE